MHRIGYARVPTVGQNLDSQLDALKGAGCTKIADKDSGVKKARPGYQRHKRVCTKFGFIHVWKRNRVQKAFLTIMAIIAIMSFVG